MAGAMSYQDSFENYRVSPSRFTSGTSMRTRLYRYPHPVLCSKSVGQAVGDDRSCILGSQDQHDTQTSCLSIVVSLRGESTVLRYFI